MFERPAGGERAVLVYVELRDDPRVLDRNEFSELAIAAGAISVRILSAPRQRAHPRYLVGLGKAEEIKLAVTESEADLVLVDHLLSPAQERNLEQLVGVRVLDRTRLILDIFAQRARSFVGKLQVELAQLQYLSTRLVRGWSHLERQKGGIGLRGPGETQLETDRRLIGKRIKQINERLAKVHKQRRQGSKARNRALLTTVAIVGYTNAGKSTLFNRLTKSDAYVADQLFATLDTTLRRLNVPGEHPVVLSDTVGFIRGLPTELIAAFQATLEQTREASLLLHVIDATAEDREERLAEVQSVLARIDADEVPIIEVYNKIDNLARDERPSVMRNSAGQVTQVRLSAKTGAGVHLLIDAIAEHINQPKERRWIRIPLSAGRLRARLFELGAVLDEIVEKNTWALEVTLPAARWANLADEFSGSSELEHIMPIINSDLEMPEKPMA